MKSNPKLQFSTSWRIQLHTEFRSFRAKTTRLDLTMRSSVKDHANSKENSLTFKRKFLNTNVGFLKLRNPYTSIFLPHESPFGRRNETSIVGKDGENNKNSRK